MKSALSVAAVSMTAMLSISASVHSAVGGNSQKGSLLIFPRIQVGASGSGIDTLISITNDGNIPVRVRCYYGTSDPLSTPYSLKAANARPTKHFIRFTLDVTHNQPIGWWASTGMPYASSARVGGQVAPPFGEWPDRAKGRLAGELKCWALAEDGSTEKVHNDLFGTATLYLGGGQAAGYNAWAFAAYGAAGSFLGSPGVLYLDSKEYDACSGILLGNFHPGGTAAGDHTRIALASCNEDFRQDIYVPTITKLVWTFWNQDELSRTGTHACADSWFETTLPAATWPLAQFASLGTEIAYFRIETTADTLICGPDAKASAYVGVIEHSDAAGNSWATTLTVSGKAARGVIRYDPGP